MANIDNRVFDGLDSVVKNNVIYRSFINSLPPNRLNDSSFVRFITSLKPSILTSSNFIEGLRILNAKDDDIITNGRFSGAIEVMDENFLRSREFVDFVNRLNPSLLERRDSTFSFSGQIRPEYIAVLKAALTGDTLSSDSLTSFVNEIELGIFKDGSFANFIVNVDSVLLQDSDFLNPLENLDESVLTNGKFTADVFNLSSFVLSTDIFGDLLSDYDQVGLANRGSDYTTIVEPIFTVLGPDQGGETVFGVPVLSDAIELNLDRRSLLDIVLSGDEVSRLSQKLFERANRERQLVSNGADILAFPFATEAEVNNRVSQDRIDERPEFFFTDAPSVATYLGSDGVDTVDLNSSGTQYVDVGRGMDFVTVLSGFKTLNGAVVSRDTLTTSISFGASDFILNPDYVRLGDDNVRDTVQFKGATEAGALLLDPGTFFSPGEFAIIEQFRADAASIANNTNDQIRLPGASENYQVRFVDGDSQIIYNNRIGIQTDIGGVNLSIPSGQVHIGTVLNTNLQNFAGEGDGVFVYG